MSTRSRAARNKQPVVEPSLSCQYLEEPKLQFADGREHVDPKIGILRYGPRTLSDGSRHPASVRVGFIGTASSVESARKWLEESSRGYAGDEKHPEFPGFTGDRGFFSSLSYDSQWISQITQSEVADLQKPRLKRDRFENLLTLIDGKLNTLSGRDLPPQYVVLCIPSELHEQWRVVEFKDQALGTVHRDFHRAFKALAMRYRIPTQIIRERTALWKDADHYSKVTWNFYTGLYFKAGGFPWGPLGLTPDSCYLGVSFFRPLGSKSRTVQSALIQAFDHHGQGLVLRGPDFEWDQDKQGTPAPHLSTEVAHQLVDLALEQYGREMDRPPQRVVIHKTSRFWEAEKEGFESAIKKRVRRYDLVALSYQNAIRLMPQSNYPPLRGTRFSIGELDFLYTTGFISELGQFHSLHVPSPLQIADHIGSDTSREQILREVLILTKLNWNSARLGGSLPITLRFSRLVGNILKELPEGTQPLTNYKFYM
jgi:hypothetical protein